MDASNPGGDEGGGVLGEIKIIIFNLNLGDENEKKFMLSGIDPDNFICF